MLAHAKFDRERLPEDLLAAISTHGVERHYPKPTILINEGEEGNSLFVVLKGKLQVFLSDRTGKEIIVYDVSAGEFVGELALDGTPRTASVRTVGPTTCLILPYSAVRELMANHPDFALHVIRKLISRLRAATGSIRNLALLDVYGRVAHTLLSLARETSSGWVIESPPTQTELAARVGCSRDMITRIMRDLKAGGYVSLVGRSIHIQRKLPLHW